MYKIIGADGKEYGPITAEQLGHWIAEGRANGQTRVQAEGTTDWRLLSELPEFAEALGARTRIQADPPPSTGTGDAEAMANEILVRGFQLDVMSCISRSWGLLMRNFWMLIGATLVEWLISSAIPVVLQSVCMGGIFYLCLRLIRGERAEFGDGFAGFSMAFLQLFLHSLVSFVLVAIALSLCVLPGIYLGVAWLFAVPLIVDKRLDFWPAMELSRKIVHRHWWTVFGLSLAVILVIILGSCVCGIGVFIAMPVAIGAIAFAYEDIFGKQPGASMTGATRTL